MVAETCIEWTEAPWNPTTGCDQLSAGWQPAHDPQANLNPDGVATVRVRTSRERLTVQATDLPREMAHVHSPVPAVGCALAASSGPVAA